MTASGQRSYPSNGNLRVVKLDYSVTYRDNDSLGDNLTSHLESLQKVHFRVNKDKDDVIQNLKKDVEKIQSLREVVNQRDTSKEISNIFSKSNKDQEEGGNGTSSSETSRVSRRLQKERERFSAKNHFNVVLPKWNPLSDISDRKQFAPASVPIQKVTVTTPTDDNRKQSRPKGYLQMTSSSRHRLARPMSVPAMVDSSKPYSSEATRSQSASRSRRQLEELSRIELSWAEPKLFTPFDQRQGFLTDLKKHQRHLQTKVSNFVTDMDRFNKRNKKDALAKYLDT
ncbi:uncharacterized protein LOC124139027 [Haliotis rufescens]|uniref:uncharacterized protein LOC124139027 n=1 Tax=Haliotis rufescens TaxID=6454 RepID=UPI00201F3FA9|nr:uncharacterized protein LOC124139027 [Haliotis rufescens]XP_046361956.2 uncharacterized protein LOC124139027 [Haliotis rufescens]XP_046361957.2 uncharacterized protein LOC124139027 [Haliotis rufescens]XP_048239464.1 uncharacterized protein LOC124139027 [Haliotis rufescens]